MSHIKFIPIILIVCGATTLSASEYEFKPTDHFGVSKLELESDFHMSAMCTISGGSSLERAEQVSDFVDLIPYVGNVLAEAMETAPLKKGEALCGLRHYKGPSAWTFAADTNGFELEIRTYLDGELIGGDAPRIACRKAMVNRFGFCFEEITLKDNDGKEADAVTACIETKRISDDKITSVVIYAGAAATAIVNEVASPETAVQHIGCSARNF